MYGSQTFRNAFKKNNLDKVANVFTTGFNLATEAPRTMGEGVGKAIVAPFEARRLDMDAQTDRLMQDRQIKSNPQSAERYANRSASNQEAFGSSLKDARKKAIIGTIGTMGTLYGAKATQPAQAIPQMAKSRLPLPPVSVPGQPRDAIGRWIAKSLSPSDQELTTMAKIWSASKGSLANLSPQKRRLFNEYVFRKTGGDPRVVAQFMSVLRGTL